MVLSSCKISTWPDGVQIIMHRKLMPIGRSVDKGIKCWWGIIGHCYTWLSNLPFLGSVAV